LANTFNELPRVEYSDFIGILGETGYLLVSGTQQLNKQLIALIYA